MNTDQLRAINALTVLVRAHDLGVDARRALTASQFKTIAAGRQRGEALGDTVGRSAAVRLAKQISGLDSDLKANQIQITKLTTEHTPSLLAMHGVGTVTAAIIMPVWSHPGRIRSEAGMTMIAGTCPIPASSGNTVRNRLNRGGDRRKISQGRSKREIMRYITRQIYRTLSTNPPLSVA